MRQAPKEREVIFIAVGGPSGIGKTTLIKGLCETYHTPCKEINMSCALTKVRDLPRYADLAAEQDSSAPDAEKLDPNQVEDCIKSTVCCNVSEAYDAQK